MVFFVSNDVTLSSIGLKPHVKSPMEAQLAECISVSVDPMVPASQRQLALSAFNRFKEDLSMIESALNLCRTPPSDQVRH